MTRVAIKTEIVTMGERASGFALQQALRAATCEILVAMFRVKMLFDLKRTSTVLQCYMVERPVSRRNSYRNNEWTLREKLPSVPVNTVPSL